MAKIKIGKKYVGDEMPFYSIAEIGSNFDNSLKKAFRLIDLAKKAGADAVKFQSFTADNLVNDDCFNKLKIGYQAKWKNSVYEVYKKAEFPKEFHQKVFNYCKKKDIEFFSAPYDKESVDFLDKLGVKVFKIGSGDITWLENIEYIAKKNKPIILATGASDMRHVENAIKTIKKTGNNQIVLMQCVTNYPASFKNINLKVLETFKKKFKCLVGYSDHTLGDIVALGTVAMGGCMIEKHFTDEKKEVYEEEKDQYVSMKRGVKSAKSLKKGQLLKRNFLKILRPCLPDDIPADDLKSVIGKKLKVNLEANKAIKKRMIF